MRTFAWLTVVLATSVVAGCHQRYPVPKDELASAGSGGPGGLTSIRMKILAAIAARDYEHARHLLELAADLADDERARFEQMISAAERKLVPFLEKALSHIFRVTPGHFPQDTAEARELIQTTVMEINFVGIREEGSRAYQRILDTGMQIWVYVFDGTIRNAGRNDVPRSVAELLAQ